MSTYKRLNKQDAYITTYTAYKTWTVSGSQFSDYNIQVIPTLTPLYSSSIAQLYYPKKVAGEIVSHSFDYYLDSTLDNPSTRNFNDNSFIISIPRALTGVELRPGTNLTFEISNPQQSLYVSNSYWNTNYVDDTVLSPTTQSINLYDDGEGGLYKSGSNPRLYVGDIIYPHGMIIITDSSYATGLRNMWGQDTVQEDVEEGEGDINTPSIIKTSTTALRPKLKMTWQSSQPIFTYNYHCRLRDFEFNMTQNPTSTSSSLGVTYDNEGSIFSTTGSIYKGDVRNNITGSEFRPYITTIGLYNDSDELIAVGKVGQPIPKSLSTDMTINIKLDI